MPLLLARLWSEIPLLPATYLGEVGVAEAGAEDHEIRYAATRRYFSAVS